MRFRILFVALTFGIVTVAARADVLAQSKANRRLAELGKLAVTDLSDARRNEVLRELSDIVGDKSVDVLAKEYAARQIQVFAGPQSSVDEDGIAKLISGLSSESDCEVIRALGALGANSKSAIPQLKQLSEDEKWPNKAFCVIHASAALAQIDPEKFGSSAREELLARLTDKRPWVRWTAADALGKEALDSAEVRLALRRALDDECVSVRAMAARALCWLGEKPDEAIVRVIRGAMVEKIEFANIKPIYPSETHPTSDEVAIGTVVLIHRKHGQVPEELKAALRKSLAHRYYETRYFALLAVKKMGLNDPATRAAVEKITRSDSPDDLKLEAKTWLDEN